MLAAFLEFLRSAEIDYGKVLLQYLQGPWHSRAVAFILAQLHARRKDQTTVLIPVSRVLDDWARQGMLSLELKLSFIGLSRGGATNRYSYLQEQAVPWSQTEFFSNLDRAQVFLMTHVPTREDISQASSLWVHVAIKTAT